MTDAPLPLDEGPRLSALRACRLLDTSFEPAYDELTELATQLFGVPIALVSLVDAERQWFKSCIGFAVRETPRSVAFCAHAILRPSELFVVEDAEQDPRFRDNPLVVGGPRIRFYAGAPLLDSEGRALGTLCIADRKPRRLAPEQLEWLGTLARQASRSIDQRRSALELAEAMERNAELQLVTLRERQRILAAIDADVRDCAAADDAVLSCLAWLRGAFPAMRCSYSIVRVHGLEVVLSLQPDSLPATSATQGYLATASVLFDRLAAGSAVSIHDVESDPAAEGIARAELCAGAGALLFAPLAGVGRERAVLLVEALHAHRWTIHDHELLSAVAEELDKQLERSPASAGVHGASRSAAEVDADGARGRSRILTALGHELRTPIHGVIGMAHELGECPGEVERRGCLEALRSSAETLDRVVTDMLDLAALDDGTFEPREEELDPHALVAEIERVHRAAAVKKGLVWATAVSSDVPRRVIGDERRIVQVLGHLVRNAIEFTEQGSVTLRASVDGDTRNGVRTLRLDVEDTGSGIPPEEQLLILGSMRGLELRPHGELGLGLALCRRILDRCGGELTLRSAPGQGSSFRARLPLRTPAIALDEPRAPFPSRASESSSSLERYQGRVLVVEDNALNQRIAVRLLERHGLTVDVAANGAEALAAVERADYQLVLMDCHMPVMDGFEATRRLRERERERPGERLPIVALSAGLRPEDRKRCLEQGMDEFLSKPCPLAALEKVLQRFLAHEPAREG